MGYGKFGVTFGAAVAIVAAAPAMAQDQGRRSYDLPAQDLRYALRAVARGAGFQLIADSRALRGKQSKALKGQYTVREALEALLQNSDLAFDISNRTVIVRGRSEPPRDTVADAADGEDILITGSRIRGAQPTSPIIVRSREDIENQGFRDLGALARSIPQNFSGGQNPGVISSFQSGSENFNSSSTMNLRGLGQDATLTLLNGHRLAYDGTTQGIDISAIPLAAIEKLEIVADGASALYGSDAVGGVANVILRRDYSGLLTSARLSGATEGGDFSHGFSIVTGFRGSNTGLMVAGDYSKSTAVTAGQRSFTRSLEQGMTLFPSQRQISGVAAFRQHLVSTLEFEADGHITHHKASTTIPFTATSDVFQSGFISSTDVLSYSVSPALKLSIAGGWRAELKTTRARSESNAQVQIYAARNLSATNRVGYENGLWSAELNAEGPLFDIGGGAVRLALGGGFRSYQLDASIRQITAAATRSLLAYNDSQFVRYAFGELAAPIVSDSNAIPGIQRLIVSAAVRYEHYRDLDGLATPKFGVTYQPVDWLVFKGSWGQSFKAPTLSQINQIPSGTLLPPSFFVPAPRTNRPTVVLSGGNPDLVAERARTWTATIELLPVALSGAKFAISYYNVNYRDRVAAPIVSTTQSFRPLYEDLILFDPSVSQVQDAVADLPLGLVNQTGQAFNPANVGAIVFARVQNVASQKIQGVDASADYAFAVGANEFTLRGAASYLESSQQLSANQAIIQMAGTLFRPPHWRGQGSASWRRGALIATAIVNRIGGVEDRRTASVVDIGGFTSLDFSVRFEPRTGLLAGFDILLSASNLFNEKPAPISAGVAQPTYDATNYSSLGRILGVTVSRSW
jgi:iron complex outermembrane receptor protein